MPGRRLAAAVLAALLVLAGCTGDGDGDAPRDSDLMRDAASDTARRWEAVAGLNVPRDDFATAVVDGRIWVLGGMTGERGNRLTSIEVYDPAADEWQLSDITLPMGLASFEGVALGGRIYVFGGLDTSSSGTDFSAVLDTRTGEWRALPPLPTARYAHTVTEHAGKIYVVGGEAVAGPVDAVDVFDPQSESWAGGGRMPRARGSHDAVSTERGIYVVGGWLHAGPTDLVQRYEPERRRWTTGPRLPEPVSRAGAAFADGRLWVSYHEFAAALHVRAGEWAAVDHPPLSRHGLGLVALGDALYAIAGCQEWPLRDVRSVDVLRL